MYQSQSSSSRGSRCLSSLALCGGVLLLALPTASAATARVARSGAAGTQKRSAYPSTVGMINSKIAHWAPVVIDVAAHREPNGASPVVTEVKTITGDGTQNIVLILKRKNVSPSQTWYDVRLAILPNNSTGWVPRSALGNVYIVATHLYIDREDFTATLKRNGIPIFTTRVGVGEPYWPTPAGQYYIRDKLTDFSDPFYGPLAFGTSGRSAVLTEWPGGGFIGVHGTNEPGLIPGAISHGCVRMLNSAVLELAKLMSVGTPVTIT
jgi:lipoprotein-anchoring transpeptidase ErfK/SrfK